MGPKRDAAMTRSQACRASQEHLQKPLQQILQVGQKREPGKINARIQKSTGALRTRGGENQKKPAESFGPRRRLAPSWSREWTELARATTARPVLNSRPRKEREPPVPPLCHAT